MLKRLKGISLLELMLSLTIATLLISLLVQQYLLSKQHYRQIQAQLAENLELQLVSDMIREVIRKAGFTPCRGLSYLQSIDRRNGYPGIKALKVQGEALQINRMGEHFVRVLQQISPQQLLLQAPFQWDNKQSILIADCYRAEVQDVLGTRKTKEGTVITLKKPLAFHYLPPTYLGEWLETKFFIKKNNQDHLALFYKQNHSDELSDLINRLNVRLDKSQGNTIVEMTLGLRESKSLLLRTRVRAG